MLDPDKYAVDVLSGKETGSEGSLIGNAKNRGINLFFEAHLVRKISPWKDISAFLKMVRLMKFKKYDVVHTHSSKAGILGRLAAKAAGVPAIVHTVHGWGFHDYQHRIIRFFYILVEKLCAQITSRLIAVADKDIAKGVAEGIGTRGDYTLIRSGIDLERFSIRSGARTRIRKELRLSDDDKVVGTVTRLSPQKAPQVFIEAAALIHKACPDVFFVIVGDGPLRKILEEKTKISGIANRVVFTGIRNDVHRLMHAFDLFLLTSLWEGLPRVIPQAMASGVPVIASRVDGNAEIIKDRENGILVDPGSPMAFAHQAIGLINNEANARQLRNHALKDIDEYSVRTMVKQIDGLYRETITDS
jgi:glycosyltransferase involved in cell wall biosynthesis